jgi:N-acetylglutamate synthase-like GNAT family acetyltransferase
MTKEEAKQIADLINKRNELTKKYSLESILALKENYVFIKQADKIIACAESKKVQWYQYEISHVSIDENYESKGFGSKILKLSENKAIENNARLLQCTIRTNNINSIRLFSTKGYKQVNMFHNLKSGNWVFIYQKIISQ